MGTFLYLQNHDDVFNRSTIAPIIVNDISTATIEQKEYLDNLITTRYEGDLLCNEPSCECGELKGGYNLNTVCRNCKTPVKEIFDQELQTLVWMRSPHGVEKLINPMVLLQLSSHFTKGGFNIIEWLCNTDYHPAIVRPRELEELAVQGVVRGYNNFVKNFDAYLNILFTLKQFKPKEPAAQELIEHLKQNRANVFSWHLPLPNKSLMVIENTPVGVFIDPIIIGAVDAVRTISGIDTTLTNVTPKQKENRTAKTLFIMSTFCMNVYDQILSSKNGLFRKHVFGSRNYFSARAVISSNTKAHKYDELHISWGVGITMLRMHLTNKLLKLKWSPNDATALLQESTYKYHPLVDQLFRELIDSSPDKGIYVTWGRNPSLTRG